MIVSIAQISPVWLNKKATAEKVIANIRKASQEGADLICFGETILPGYPYWIELTDGARFESSIQKEIHAHYLKSGIDVQGGDLKTICQVASKHQIAVYLGTAERAMDRGGHSIYCSLVYIDKNGVIQSVHRKLMPTHEERMAWAIGDGHGLVTHSLEEFTVGGLNCWENWMPLARAALYGQGENLHVSVWPGNERNTIDLTRHIAKESRSYVISACGLMGREHIPDDFPYAELIRSNAPEWMGNGGSCLAAPDGSWVIPPFTKEEKLVTAEISMDAVLKERHNFDPSGHYSRPDVLQVLVNASRQKVVKINS